ncbi:hypothetical protein [[Kitasatospora] papulosa]|uniref:hypothetical protein n=1 Tax=[Kitasatospora] papulosa TaxID=1464011 RepID=UPI0036827208
MGLVYDGQTGCDAIIGCVCDHSGAGLTCANGMVQVMPSGDAGNVLTIGSDGGVMVPTAGASAGILAGQAVTITGSQAAGYTIGAKISADAENSIGLGSDGGLYVAGPRFAYGNLASRAVTLTITDNWMVPTITGQSGGFSVLPVSGGIVRVRLPDAGTWFLQMQTRWDTSAGYTIASGALIYCGISSAARGIVHAESVTRPSSVTGMHASTMEDFNDVATPTISFRVQASSTHAAQPTVTGWWSAHRVGPSVQ